MISSKKILIILLFFYLPFPRIIPENSMKWLSIIKSFKESGRSLKRAFNSITRSFDKMVDSNFVVFDQVFGRHLKMHTKNKLYLFCLDCPFAFCFSNNVFTRY
jgi:hypothetical protein